MRRAAFGVLQRNMKRDYCDHEQNHYNSSPQCVATSFFLVCSSFNPLPDNPADAASLRSIAAEVSGGGAVLEYISLCEELTPGWDDFFAAVFAWVPVWVSLQFSRS